MADVSPVYGCHNRAPFRDTVVVQQGWKSWRAADGPIERESVLVEIPFRMSRVCEFTKSALGQADKRCTGCSWRQGAAS